MWLRLRVVFGIENRVHKNKPSGIYIVTCENINSWLYIVGIENIVHYNQPSILSKATFNLRYCPRHIHFQNWKLNTTINLWGCQLKTNLLLESKIEYTTISLRGCIVGIENKQHNNEPTIVQDISIFVIENRVHNNESPRISILKQLIWFNIY